jgi:4-hydroxybenzoate polyprenyltransferase
MTRKTGVGTILRLWLREARVYQWVKNTLVFAPMVAGQALADTALVERACLAFVAFCLLTSGGYILNDLMDLASDRVHASKRNRPLASGELATRHAAIAAAILFAASLLLGFYWLGRNFVLVELGYLVGAVWYSVDIKRRAIVDILFLAGLYTIRIVAGSAATGIMPSFWLLAFSIFLFLSLAAAKRFAELAAVESRHEQTVAGRGYSIADLPLLMAFGVAAAYSSVLVLAWYVFRQAEVLYAEPQLLWLLCPALLYWVSRIWLKAHRRQLHEDPLVFALRDWPSLAAAALCVVITWVAA